MNSLRELDTELWAVEAPQSYMGLPVGTRMTVLRSGGSLVLISPVKMHDALVSALSKLGQVRHIIAPNNFHYLHAQGCKHRFPDAVLWAAPGLARRSGTVSCDRQLPSAGEFLDDIRICRLDALGTMGMSGARAADEHLFLHEPSRTLITTDLLFNFSRSAPRRLRLALKLLGGGCKPGMTNLEKWATPDRTALWGSFAPVLGWDYDRVIMAHGDIIESDGKKTLEASVKAFCRS